jgi:hypothetical protein
MELDDEFEYTFFQSDRERELYYELADLFAVSKDQRKEFFLYVCGIENLGWLPHGSFPTAVRAGDVAYEKAEYHIRGLVTALKRVNCKDAEPLHDAFDASLRREFLFRIRKQPETKAGPRQYEYVPVGVIELLDEVLIPLAEALSHLVGRHPHFPKAKDWVLTAVIEDVRTWPQRFSTRTLEELELKDHRSKKLQQVFALLHEIHPAAVPERVPPSTIRDIWKPRKDVRNN